MLEFFSAHRDIIGQIFGFAAMATAMSMYQFKKHKTIMALSVLCGALWCIHFGFLGHLSPIMMNFLNVIRGFVYSKRSDHRFDKKFIPLLFSVASIVLTVVTWDNWWSLLPGTASVFASYASWQIDTKKLKLLTVPVCVEWFVYNAANGSVPGMINEAITLGSICVALIRLRRENKRSESCADGCD